LGYVEKLLLNQGHAEAFFYFLNPAWMSLAEVHVGSEFADFIVILFQVLLSFDLNSL